MNVLHLFAGAGGGVLADRLLGFRTVGYVEIDPYCQAVLKARIQDGFLDPAPIFGDVREFIRAGHAREYRGVADVVVGGFPCQPFSVAGKRKGSADNRNLWPEFAEVVGQVQPAYVFAENVPGLLTWDGGRYFGRIVGDLAALGYGIRWCVLGADDVGAPHRRKRLWILAYPPGSRCRQGNTDLGGCYARETPPKERRGFANGNWWETEPQLGRVAHRVAHRMDRLRAIGNGQVPLVAATAWRLLMARHRIEGRAPLFASVAP